MAMILSKIPLRTVLLADALISGVTSLLLVIGASVLSPILLLPEPLLRYAGLLLLPFALFVAFVATREQLSPKATWAVILINGLWAIDSIALLFTPWVSPNLLGYSFIVFQAVVVGILAELQYLGLRQSTT